MDILYFLPSLDPETSNGFRVELGPALLFFFDGNVPTVERTAATSIEN